MDAVVGLVGFPDQVLRELSGGGGPGVAVALRLAPRCLAQLVRLVLPETKDYSCYANQGQNGGDKSNPLEPGHG